MPVAGRVDSDGTTADAEALVGSWQIDLRPMPDSEPYYQEFVVELIDGTTFTVTFYGSPVSETRLNTDLGCSALLVTSMGGSGAYLHAGVLRDDRLEGTTNSTGRGVLSVWSGERCQ